MNTFKLLLIVTALMFFGACADDPPTSPALASARSPSYSIGDATSTTICADAANTVLLSGAGAMPAFNTPTINPAWRTLLSFPGSHWIGPQANSNSAFVPVGSYTFVTAFSVSHGESINGQILADNGATVYLNDNVIATLGAVDTSVEPSYDTMQRPTELFASSGFVRGVNNLKVVVYNAAPTGPSGTSYCFTVVGLGNTSPLAEIGGPYTGAEGSPVALSLSGFDADKGDVLTYEWDMGDGTAGSGSTPPATHVYVNDGIYAVSLKVTDEDGGTDTRTTTAEIANVAPVVGAITAASSLVPVGTNVTVSASISDAGTEDTHTVLIDWQDGTSSVDAIDNAVGGSHVYEAGGVYRVTITATDNGGAESSPVAHEYIVVYDPSAGFVSGGGWILSPSGAYADDPSISGAATFGFVSKYLKGANIPTGRTQFQFRAAGLEFSSTSYEWLVVAGAKAQYKGEGTVNGVSGYRFLLFATDGQVSGGGGIDKFRIRIVGPDDSLVYDNQPATSEAEGATTSLGGGSILIHSK